MATILDIGCGGDPERWIPGSIKIDWDINEKFAKEHNITVRNLCNGFPDFIFDSSVDIITARYSLSYIWDHTEDLARILKDVVRVLRPGGMFYVQDYCHLYDDREGTYKEVPYYNVRRILVGALHGLKKELTLEFGEPGNSEFEYMWVFRKEVVPNV